MAECRPVCQCNDFRKRSQLFDPSPRFCGHYEIKLAANWCTAVCRSKNAVNISSARMMKRDAVIRVYDDAGNVIETHEHKGDFKDW
jgi:hypothetical protein